MVLDTVFAAADRSLWGEGGWFTVKDYLDVGKFTCDGVSLRNDYKPSKGTWGPGLELAAKLADEAHVRVKIRAVVHNPRHNHDKFVNLFFEVLNGDELVESVRMPPIKAQDDADEVDKEVALVVPLDALKTAPMTRLRITMSTIDD